MTNRRTDRLARRRFLTVTGGAAGAALAGCTDILGSEDGGDDEGWIGHWNEAFVGAVQEARDGNVAPTRRNALMNVAIFDAVNEIAAARGEDHYESYLDGYDDPPEDASQGAAGAAAAHEVLSTVYASDFTGLYEHSMEEAEEYEGDVEAGEQWGRTVGQRLLQHREGDGGYEFTRYFPCPDNPGGPGCFRHNWSPERAYVDPWVMDERNQFRPSGPPPLDSEAYAEAWHEVYEYGRDREDRPQEEVDIAAFWRGSSGSPRPPNMWTVVATHVSDGLGILEKARLFALLGLSLADSGIAASESKEHYGFWRPQSAIHGADTDGNAETEPDDDWAPLATGGSPEYAAGLATFGGAGAAILQEFFGDDVSFEFGGDIRTGLNGDTEGVTRSFDSFSEARDESLDSRIYVGNHFRFSVNDGKAMGEEIAQWTLDNYLRPV